MDEYELEPGEVTDPELSATVVEDFGQRTCDCGELCCRCDEELS